MGNRTEYSCFVHRMTPNRAGRVFEQCVDPRRFDATPVTDFVESFSPAPTPWLLPPSGAKFAGESHARIIGDIAARDPNALPDTNEDDGSGSPRIADGTVD
jgi:hypothetical protein|tara:strand:- start:187 stop:489 length:303 start_codon:yes stop_codon:yes gene_type:complete